MDRGEFKGSQLDVAFANSFLQLVRKISQNELNPKEFMVSNLVFKVIPLLKRAYIKNFWHKHKQNEGKRDNRLASVVKQEGMFLGKYGIIHKIWARLEMPAVTS